MRGEWWKGRVGRGEEGKGGAELPLWAMLSLQVTPKWSLALPFGDTSVLGTRAPYRHVLRF